MTRSVVVALLLASHLGGCQKKEATQSTPPDAVASSAEQAKAEALATEKAAAEKAAAEKAAAEKAAAVEPPPNAKLSKEHAASVKALQTELDAAAHKLTSLHEKVATFPGPKKASAERSLAEVDSAHVNIQADLAKLDGPEIDDFDDARTALEAGVKSFAKTVDVAELKIAGKPAH